jgi:hypothetical protein
LLLKHFETCRTNLAFKISSKNIRDFFKYHFILSDVSRALTLWCEVNVFFLILALVIYLLCLTLNAFYITLTIKNDVRSIPKISKLFSFLSHLSFRLFFFRHSFSKNNEHKTCCVGSTVFFFFYKKDLKCLSVFCLTMFKKQLMVTICWVNAVVCGKCRN